MPPPIIDERFLQRIRANYGELGAPAFVYGGGGLGPGEQGPEVPGYDAVSRKVMLDRLRGRPGALNRLQQQMGPQGGMQGPEPQNVMDDNGRLLIANDPRNQAQPAPGRIVGGGTPADAFGGIQNNVMDGMYGPQDPGAIALGRMKQLGVDVAGMTAADAQAALAKPIEKGKGTDIEQLRSRVQGAINARDPNYVSGWDMKKIKQARRKAFKKQKSMERGEAARRRAATPRIMSPAAQLKQQLSANPIARRRATQLMRIRSGAMGGMR